jgi:predicted RecB family endonuclease
MRSGRFAAAYPYAVGVGAPFIHVSSARDTYTEDRLAGARRRVARAIRRQRTCGVEVLTNFAEHVVALGIDRADNEGIRIGVDVPA